MNIKRGIYSLLLLSLILSSCVSSKKVNFFQSESNRKGASVEIPSFRFQSIIRFKPDDILSITVNVPGFPQVANDYNLPLIPSATTETASDESVPQGFGRQSYLIKKDGTIDFPVLGSIKVAGYTQGELEDELKNRLMAESLQKEPIITVRLQNFIVMMGGEVGSPGGIRIVKDHINIAEALAMAGNMTIYGKRDDVQVYREMPNGSYHRFSLDISREDIISDPRYFLQQNDYVYVPSVKSRTHSADISPLFNVSLSVATFIVSVLTLAMWLSR